MHPSLLKWVLHPEPAGRNRLAFGYLVTAAGTTFGLIIFGITVAVTRHCQVGAAGFGCLTSFFHGFGLSIIAGLVVTTGLSIFVKLGFRFVLGLLALAAPVLLIPQLLAMAGVEPRPYALLALVAVPGAAAWITERMLREPRPIAPRPVDRPATVRSPHLATSRS